MSDWLMAHEPMIRLGFFVSVLGIMALWEVASPRRRIEIPRLVRWTNNLGIVILDSLLVRLLFPLAATGVALLAHDSGWGLFNMLELPLWLVVILTVVLFDLAIYAQHVAFHKVPALWRLHRMHHADTAIDVTTGLRFHPIEIILSMGIKMALVVVLGAPAVGILIFEVILNATAMFNHSNIRLPNQLDRVVRWVLVTPDMHRVHHSVHQVETDSNYGFALSLWDRLFKTYTAQPKDGHDDMLIGIEIFRERREHWLDRMLIQPFR